jgi:hypothetical protein
MVALNWGGADARLVMQIFVVGGGGRLRYILEPNSRGLTHLRDGVSAWTHLANSGGRCPPLCGPDTEQ